MELEGIGCTPPQVMSLGEEHTEQPGSVAQSSASGCVGQSISSVSMEGLKSPSAAVKLGHQGLGRTMCGAAGDQKGSDMG